MSIICNNCGAELPDEANFCLNCMTSVNKGDSNAELYIANDSLKTKLHIKTAAFISKLSELPKMKKIALISALVLLFILVPLSAFLFSPVDAAKNTASLPGSNTASEDKPVTRFESLIDEVFGTANKDGENSTENGANSTGTAERIAGNSVINGNIETSGTTGATTNLAGNKESDTQTGENSSSSDTNDNNSGSTNTSSKPVLNYDDWEYTISNSKATITKYTGNDKNIIVPDNFDGANVSYVSSGTFKDNSSIETVTFKDSEEYHAMTISGSAFNNCSSLKKVTFPKNTNLGIYDEFAVNCPNFSDIEIEFSQFRFVDGGLYDYNGSTWVLKEYCEGYTASTYNVPSWCTNISNVSTNISNNKYLKTINIHNNCYAPSKQWNYYEYSNLENINVESSNPNYVSENGILYNKSGSKLQLRIYPAGKKDKTFNVAENCTIDCYGMKKGLFKNVETIILPASSTISSSTINDILKYYPNLKTIKVEKGHSQYQNYKSNLDNLVNVVEY